MSHLIGRGRYATETYPSGPGGGGGAGGASVPLSRQRFIDGDTVQTGLNGSAAEPFKTIEDFTTARDADLTSANNARANFVGWLTPAILGYVEDVSFPAYASTELRADSMSLAGGTIVTGNMTWNNTAGDFVPDNSAVVALHNVTVGGDFTVTDDAEAPPSIVSLSGDEAPGGACAILSGNFISNTTVRLLDATFNNVHVVGDIDAGVQGIGANAKAIVIITGGSLVDGDITAQSLICDDASLSGLVFTVDATGVAAFHNTAFSGINPSLVAVNPVGAVFDGPSWNSFMETGGTRAAGTIVLVEGGYNAGSVEGAALTGATTSVSLNGAGATAGYTGENSGNHYTTSNGTPTTVTLMTGGGEKVGDTILITKTDLGANVLAVHNNAAATIGSIPTLARGFVLARFNGSDWVFAAGGSMLA